MGNNTDDREIINMASPKGFRNESGGKILTAQHKRVDSNDLKSPSSSKFIKKFTPDSNKSLPKKRLFNVPEKPTIDEHISKAREDLKGRIDRLDSQMKMFDSNYDVASPNTMNNLSLQMNSSNLTSPN